MNFAPQSAGVSRLRSAAGARPVRGQPVLNASTSQGVSCMEAMATGQYAHVLSRSKGCHAHAAHFVCVAAGGGPHSACGNSGPAAQAAQARRAGFVRLVLVLQGTCSAASQLHRLMRRQRGHAAEGHSAGPRPGLGARRSSSGLVRGSSSGVKERQKGIVVHQLAPRSFGIGFRVGRFVDRRERHDAHHWERCGHTNTGKILEPNEDRREVYARVNACRTSGMPVFCGRSHSWQARRTTLSQVGPFVIYRGGPSRGVRRHHRARSPTRTSAPNLAERTSLLAARPQEYMRSPPGRPRA